MTTRLLFGTNWVFYSGNPVTFPVGRYEIMGTIIPLYSKRNSYRLPPYHRLDLSATLSSRDKPGKRWKGEWNLSVYNVYARKNIWAVNFIQDEDNPSGTYAEKTYLFSVIPSVSYNFNF